MEFTWNFPYAKSISQPPLTEVRGLQLCSLNPYEINVRYIGHQERVFWHNRLPVRPVDTFDPEVAVKQCGLIALAHRLGLGTTMPDCLVRLTQCQYFSAQAVYPVGA